MAAQHNFTHFGELYRAAFAESDLERKLVLLREVRKAIEDWEQRLHDQPADPRKAVSFPVPAVRPRRKRPGKPPKWFAAPSPADDAGTEARD